MMMKITPWALGVVLALPPAMAVAWQGPPTCEEFAAARAAAFDEADANDDGALTLEEFRTLMEMRERKHFERLDTNHDGLVSAEELQEGRGKRGRRGHGGRGPHW